MKLRLALCLAALLALPLSLGNLAVADETASAAAPALRVVGLRTFEALPRDREFGMMRMGLREAEGTTITLRVDYPQGALLRLSDKSTFDVITDDKGRDLSPTTSGKRHARIGATRFSRSRRTALIDLRAPQLPSRGAAALRIKGKLLLEAASGKTTERSEPAMLANGTKLVTKAATFEVSDIGEGDDQFPLQFRLRSIERKGLVYAVRILDADGKPVKYQNWGQSQSHRKDGNSGVQRKFAVASKLEKLRIEVVAWDPIRTIEVPFDLPVSLGH